MIGGYDIAIIFVWLALMLALGKYLARSVSNTDDFYLANRAMPVTLVICALGGCNLGMYNFLAEAGNAAQQGVSIIWHEWTGNMAFAFAGLFILPAFRRLKLTTVPEFMGLRYGPKAHTLTAFMYSLKSAAKLSTMMYMGAYAASIIIPQLNFYVWICIFALVVGVYTYEGGMVSLIFTSAAQFIMILIASLIGYSFIAAKVGGLPGIVEKLPAEMMNFVPAQGKFDYKFIIAILFLGVNAWTCDQSMLQRSFGSKNVKTLVRAMVLTGIVLTPINPFHFFSGLAARILVPEAPSMSVDAIMIQLYTSLIPTIFLGLFIAGLLSGQLSVIGAELNAGATVLAQDIWQRWRRTEPSPQQKLRFSRLMTLLMTGLMLFGSILVLKVGSVVDVFLSIIGIFDTPIFVIAILYGLKVRRINQAGAIAGYLGGAVCGGAARWACMAYNLPDYLFYTTVSAFLGAAIIALVVSLFFAPPDRAKIDALYEREQEEDKDWYHIIPRSVPGKITLGLIIAGAALFFAGILIGGAGGAHASLLAVGGMVVYFVGCGARLLFD